MPGLFARSLSALSSRLALVRKLLPVVLLLAIGVSAFVAYALAARFVLHGPVTSESLYVAVDRDSGSAGGLLGQRGRCHTTRKPRTWTCSVYDSAGSGGVDYRVNVSADSSCFRGQLTADHGEPGMPRRISGCVRRWQWTLLGDLL